MTRKKKKKKIKWSGLVLVVSVFALLLSGLIALVWYLGSLLVGWMFPVDKVAEEEIVQQEIVVDPALLRQDSVRSEQVEKLVDNWVLRDSTLLGLCVYDATTRQTVYEHHAKQPFIPASCMKVPTAIAALEILGMDHAYTSTLQVRGEMVGDTLVGEVLLQADDDPIVQSLDTLIGMLKDAGIHAVRGSLQYDITREDKLNSHPSTEAWDITERKLSVLLKGSAFIKAAFREALSRKGVPFQSADVKFDEPWRVVARLETPLTDVLTPMLIHSSNVKAEAVFYHLDLYQNLLDKREMHWEHTHAVESFWMEQLRGEGELFGLENVKMNGVAMKDGSGLSPLNRLTPRVLVEMLLYAWDKESLRNYLIDEALASPGDPIRRGSLRGRMSAPMFQNRIFVKTGTLTSEAVSSLAGYIHSTDDHWYIFSIINQRCPVADGRVFQDEFCKLFVK